MKTRKVELCQFYAPILLFLGEDDNDENVVSEDGGDGHEQDSDKDSDTDSLLAEAAGGVDDAKDEEVNKEEPQAEDCRDDDEEKNVHAVLSMEDIKIEEKVDEKICMQNSEEINKVEREAQKDRLSANRELSVSSKVVSYNHFIVTASFYNEWGCYDTNKGMCVDASDLSR